MTTDEALIAVIDALNDLGLPYLIVGSFSSNFYGIGRATNDADLVVNLESRSIHDLAKRLGTEFTLDPQMSFETITSTSQYVFQLRKSPFKIEFFLLSQDEHDQQRFARRRQIQLLTRPTFIATVEDVIVMKLRWAASRASKDRDDLLNVIGVSGNIVDWSYVYAWCDRHGTRELLDSIRQSIPPE